MRFQIKYLFKKTLSSCICGCVCVCVAIQLLRLLQRVNCAVFLLQYRTNNFKPKAKAIYCYTVFCGPSLSSSFAHVHMHTQNYTNHRFPIHSHCVLLAASINSIRNYMTFSYLLTLPSIRGNGVNGCSLTLKIILSNETPQTPVKWS